MLSVLQKKLFLLVVSITVWSLLLSSLFVYYTVVPVRLKITMSWGHWPLTNPKCKSGNTSRRIVTLVIQFDYLIILKETMKSCVSCFNLSQFHGEPEEASGSTKMHGTLFD